MPVIITNKNRVSAANQYSNQISKTPTYVYIADSGDWPDEPYPPNIKDDSLCRIANYSNVIAYKRIERGNTVPLIRRINWESGEVYDEYTDDYDLFNEKNPETLNFFNFYVLTSEFNVYKCLSNNGRSSSSTMPSGTSINAFQTPDGYIWKYMYTLQNEDIFGALTTSFIPCRRKLYNDGSAQWLTQINATPMSIEHIEILNGGSGYTTAPTVNISGTGSGATATAVVSGGVVTSIIVSNKGTNYKDATVTLTGGGGNGATARAIISPISGHGYDAQDELGARYLLVKVDLEGNESGLIPTDIEYRKLGVVSEPLSTELGTKLIVANPEMYNVGDVVTQSGTSSEGTVSSVNESLGYVFLRDVTGVFNNMDVVSSNPNNEVVPYGAENVINIPATNTVVDAVDMVPMSGDLLGFATREVVTRNDIQNESIRFVITF